MAVQYKPKSCTKASPVTESLCAVNVDSFWFDCCSQLPAHGWIFEKKLHPVTAPLQCVKPLGLRVADSSVKSLNMRFMCLGSP